MQLLLKICHRSSCPGAWLDWPHEKQSGKRLEERRWEMRMRRRSPVLAHGRCVSTLRRAGKAAHGRQSPPASCAREFP